MDASAPVGTAPMPSPDPAEVLNHLKSIPSTGDIKKPILYNYCAILITQHREKFFKTFLFYFFPSKMTLPCSRIPLCDSQAKAALACRESLKSGLGGGLGSILCSHGIFLQEEHRLGASAQKSGTENAQPHRITITEPPESQKPLWQLPAQSPGGK